MKKKMLSMLMAVLMLSALFTTGAFAADETSGSCGAEGSEVTWAFDANSGMLFISGTGEMKDYGEEEETPWAEYAGSITNLFIGSGVTKIGTNAFAGLTLASVTAPCSLKDNLPAATETKLTHKVEKIARVEPTNTTTGNIEYWKCSVCQKLFEDEDYTTETTADKVVLAKLDSEAPVPSLITVNNGIQINQPTDNTSQASAAVIVYATDGPTGNSSGLEAGEITLKHSTNSYAPELTCTLKANSGNQLTGTLPIYYSTPSGTYYVSKLVLLDKAGNKYENTEAHKGTTLLVNRSIKGTGTATLTLDKTSMGYGGTTKGTIIFKDIYGNEILGRSFDVYVGTQKVSTTTLDDDGRATFSYTCSIAGTYSLKATFTGDTDYYACESNIVTLTVTNVPATGDSYDLGLWICVAAAAIGVNAWFIFKRKRA